MVGDITQILGPDDKETNTRLFQSRPGSKLKGITTDITTVAKNTAQDCFSRLLVMCLSLYA